MIILNTLLLNIVALKSIIQWICIGLIFFLIVYSSLKATLYDDAKKKMNKSHESYRSIHVSWGSTKVSFGLPIPIISKAENEEILKYKKKYNKIILGLWITIIIAIVAFIV